MFRRLRLKLALQFTGLVFFLMLVLGVVFIAIEFTDVNRQLDNRLQRQATAIKKELRLPISVEQARWLHREAYNVKLATGDGQTLYASDIFARLPVGLDEPPLRTVRADGSSYRVLTTDFPGRDDVVLQLAGQDRIGPAELPGEIAVFFIAALLVTVLTAFLGLWFARRSLAPAERMFERLTQFTHDASHELRTPLTVVNSELDLALRTGEPEQHILAAKEELKVGAGSSTTCSVSPCWTPRRSRDGPWTCPCWPYAEVERLAPLAKGKEVRLSDRHRACGSWSAPTRGSWPNSSRTSSAMPSSSRRRAARSR